VRLIGVAELGVRQKSMSTYHLIKDPIKDLTDITITGEVEVAPSALVRLFGLPSQGDGHKISGEYIFRNDSNEVFVLHDWMATNQCFKEGLSSEEFWQMSNAVEFSISSLDLDSQDFVIWLKKQLTEIPGQDNRGQQIIYL